MDVNMNPGPNARPTAPSTSAEAYATPVPTPKLFLKNWIVAVANQAGALGLGVLDVGERSELNAK